MFSMGRAPFLIAVIPSEMSNMMRAGEHLGESLVDFAPPLPDGAEEIGTQVLFSGDDAIERGRNLASV